MINGQMPQVQQFISELLELQKYTFDTDYNRLFCFWQILFFFVSFAYFDEPMSSIGGYEP